MNRILLYTLLTFLFLPLGAQEELTTAYFPRAGDTLKVEQADLDWAATLDLQLEGGKDLTWNFDDPVSLSQVSSPIDAADNPNFPNADITIMVDALNQNYYRLDDSLMSLVGFVTQLEIFPGFELSAPVDPAQPTRRTGFGLGDTLTSFISSQTILSPDSLPAEALDLFGADLINQFDSLRLTRLSRRVDEVDASGTVNLDGVTYATLRERRRAFTEVRLEIKNGFIDWTDATPFAQTSDVGLAELLGPQDTVDTYVWWSNDSKEAIARVEINLAGELIGMQYKSGDTSTSIDGAAVDHARVNLYPNPASDFTNFEISGLGGGRYQVRVHNVLGRQVYRREFSAIGNQTQLLLDVSQLSGGLYFISLRNPQGRILTTRRLKVN